MPIERINYNPTDFFSANPDPKFDSIRTFVVSPDYSQVYDYETFEYFIETWQKAKLYEKQHYIGAFHDAFINYSSEILSPFYVFLRMNFNEYDEEKISEFVSDGEIHYWEEGYWENKYPDVDPKDGYVIKQEDYENAIYIRTIKELYQYIYPNANV